ncbi:hypothetical protein RYZ26_06645 [Terasakiella sp. A23]|uniref:hypothetical protein n=1 Tax=Terasakiella sp. FCG-A23 TaxID=3080561 RepID=UPI0029536082|nr:hypothetical protein [Terasakiella sp. A23]MDV7339264.1 hypothetical protein [Terasakiella sp. A23]
METNSPTKARSLVEFTANKTQALSITDRIHTADGELAHSVCRTDIDFTVQYEGYWFAVHADQKGTEALLRVHGIIGHLPFSYGNAFARGNILAVVTRASRAIHGKVRVDDQQRILLIDEVKIKGSLSPKIILAETTKILLKLKPYLQLVTSLQPAKATKFTAPTNYRRQTVPKSFKKPEEPKPAPVKPAPTPVAAPEPEPASEAVLEEQAEPEAKPSPIRSVLKPKPRPAPETESQAEIEAEAPVQTEPKPAQAKAKVVMKPKAKISLKPKQKKKSVVFKKKPTT